MAGDRSKSPSISRKGARRGSESVVRLSPEVQRLAALPNVTAIATHRADGSVQLHPIWFEFEDGHFILNSNTRRGWPKNLQRTKEATLLLVDPENYGRYAQIQGRLIDVEPDPDREVINRLAKRYTGRNIARVAPGEVRITFKIAPTKVTGQLI